MGAGDNRPLRPPTRVLPQRNRPASLLPPRLYRYARRRDAVQRPVWTRFQTTNRSDHPPAIEVYRGRRYFAVTGSRQRGRRLAARSTSPTSQWLITEQDRIRRRTKASGDGPRTTKPLGQGVSRWRRAQSWRRILRANARRAARAPDPDIAEWAKPKGATTTSASFTASLTRPRGRNGINQHRGRRKAHHVAGELNDRFALLETPRQSTVYISRADNLPIKDDDLRAPPRGRSGADRGEGRQADLRRPPTRSGQDTRGGTSTGALRSPTKERRPTR